MTATSHNVNATGRELSFYDHTASQGVAQWSKELKSSLT